MGVILRPKQNKGDCHFKNAIYQLGFFLFPPHFPTLFRYRSFRKYIDAIQIPKSTLVSNTCYRYRPGTILDPSKCSKLKFEQLILSGMGTDFEKKNQHTAVPSLHFSWARGPACGALVTRSHNPGSDVPAAVSVTQKNTFSWVRKKVHKKSEYDVFVF